MKFSWDSRKARSNERKHKVSFSLAQHALETGLGLPLDEQILESEWRTLVIAPYRARLLLAIVFTIRYEGDQPDADDSFYHENPHTSEAIVRIISARKASREEEAFYFANRVSIGE